MLNVDMTLLFKSFTLCALLLGSMISQVFCEEPNDTNSIVVAAVPKSKEASFTKADLVSAINDLNLKYTKSQYDYASELCPSSPTTASSSATATLSYAPKIVGNDVVFYLPKNTNLDTYLTSDIGSFKEALNQANSKYAEYITKFQALNSPVKSVSYTDFQGFIKNFKFDKKKFVKKAPTEPEFNINGDNFKNEIFVLVSKKALDDIFKSVQQQIDVKKIVTKDEVITAVMNEITNSQSTQNSVVTLENLFKKFGELKKPTEGIWGYMGKSIGYMTMFSGTDAVKFIDFKNYYAKFLIQFIEIKSEIEPFFEYLSAVVNESNPESNIKKVLEKILEKDKPKFKKSIEQFITTSMNNDFSKTPIKKDEFNKKTNEKFPKQVDFNVTEADIDDTFLNLKIPNVDGSDTEILNKYLNYLKDQKHFDNLKDLTMENFASSFSLVQKEENINQYFDAHPSTNKPDDKPDDKPKDKPDDKPKDKPDDDEQQQGMQQQDKQQQDMQNQDDAQLDSDNTQGGELNNQTKNNSKNFWLKLGLSIGGFFLLTFVSIGGYAFVKHVQSKRASEEFQA